MHVIPGFSKQSFLYCLLQVIARGPIVQETAILIRKSKFHLQNFGCKNALPYLFLRTPIPDNSSHPSRCCVIHWNESFMRIMSMAIHINYIFHNILLFINMFCSIEL